jgi:NAD(P)H-flavin reductase
MHALPEIATADPMAPHPMRVLDRWDETYDTFTMVLDAPGGFAFEPGQFNMLSPFGIGESAISISGDPADGGRLIHTVRRVGKVTEALARLRPGDWVGVRGPFGAGWPVQRCEGVDMVFVAGGLGLPPMRPAIYQVFAHRECFRRVKIIYGARTPDDMVFVKELSEWRGRFDCDVLLTVDAADQKWHGSVGVVTRLIPRADFDESNAVAMVCGPEVMMRFSAAELVKRGIPKERIHVSMERSMKCGIGFCGHCQFGPYFVCKEGPVFRYDQVEQLLQIREV